MQEGPRTFRDPLLSVYQSAVADLARQIDAERAEHERQLVQEHLLVRAAGDRNSGSNDHRAKCGSVRLARFAVPQGQGFRRRSDAGLHQEGAGARR